MNKAIEVLYENFLSDDMVGTDDEYNLCRKIFADSFDEATKNLDEETRHEIEKTLDKFSSMSSRNIELTFEYGFKLGANLMLGVLKNEVANEE